MSDGRRAIVTGSARRWDERRNTSRVQPVPPDALPNALRALAELRRREPELVAWLEDGHPTMTEDEHRARFGCDYERAKAKR